MTKTCLVVDDSQVVRMVTRKILESLGFAVVEAENGEVALAKVLDIKPDVILLDCSMPVMNGLKVLQELRMCEEISQPVVVFCTTDNDVEHIDKAIEAGANEYIMKPFDRGIVESKFQELGLV